MPKRYMNKIALGVLLVSIIYYFLVPLTGDVFVFISHAYITDTEYGGGLINAIRVWELKPLSNRVFFYVLYHLATLIAGNENLVALHIALKLFYLLLILCAAWGVMNVCERGEKKAQGVSRFFVFSLACAVLMLISFSFFFQCEYNAVLFCLIAAGILSQGKYGWKVCLLSLPLLVIATGFKILTVVMVFQTCILLILFGQCPWRRAIVIFCSTIAAFIFCTLCIFFIYPQEISDFMLVPILQGNNTVSFSLYLKHLIFLIISLFSPRYRYAFLLPFLFFSAALIVDNFFHNRKIGCPFFLAISFFSGFMAIVIQHKYFFYHYAFVLIPVITGLFLLWTTRWNRKKILCAIIIISIPLFGLLFMNTPLQQWGPWSGRKFDWTWSSITQYEQQKKICKFINPRNNRIYTAFYFDDGSAPFLFRYRNICRFFFPLPLLRRAYKVPEYQDCLLSLKSQPDFLVVFKPFFEEMISVYPEYKNFYDLAYEIEDYIVFRHKNRLCSPRW